MGEQNKNDRITIRVNRNFKKEYKKLCESKGYTYSKRVLAIIEADFDKLKNVEI